METGRRTLAPHAFSGFLLAVFVGFGLRDIGRAPKVYEDEAWIAAPGYTFVTTGVFGTQLDRGFYGTERHCYGFMPLFPIAVGACLRVFGLGLAQARLVPLATATGVLLLTHRIGSRLLSPWHGVTAVALLVLAPVASPVAHLGSGIPLADLARLVRYDIPVPFFGLAALLVLVPVFTTGREPAPGRLFGAGLLTGLAALSHVYGIFWLPALLFALVTARGRRVLRVALLPSIAGFLLASLPWLLFAAGGWHDFLGQNRNAADRFDLLDPGFYLENLRGEISRYGLVLKAMAFPRLSPWLFVVSAAAGAFVLFRRGPRALLAVSGVLALAFALLLRSKNVLYLATLWPLLALIAAAGLGAVWDVLPRFGRGLLFLVCLAAAAEGVRERERTAAEARGTTPYADFTRRLSAAIPDGGRVVGMQHYWFGLAGKFPDYATVPLHRTLARFTEQPVSFAEAVDGLAPDVFVVDQVLRDFFRDNDDPGAEFHGLAADVQRWVAERGRSIAVLEDPTYGRVEVYAIDVGKPPGS